MHIAAGCLYSKENRMRNPNIAEESTHRQSRHALLSEVSELRRRARQSLDDGAVTPSYSADKENRAAAAE